MNGLLQDVRYAARQLRKNFAFTIVAVVTLALAIGATTAIFSVVHVVLLAPLPYHDVDRLAMIWERNPAHGDGAYSISPGDFTDWKQKNDVFEDIAASFDNEVTLTGAGDPKLLIGYNFTPNYFRILGVAPKLGRTFTDEEAKSGANLVVLSDAFWRNTLHGDPHILGESITLNGKLFSVIGIMPPEFDYPPKTDLWMPLHLSNVTDYEHGFIHTIGRLRPGVSMAQAQTRMNALERQIDSLHPETNAGKEAWVVPLREGLVGDIRTPLLALFGAVGFVLLIACANVAGLLLARATYRRAETSVRVAIGASRTRLLQQFLTESLMLSLFGGALGTALVPLSTRFLLEIFPNHVANMSIPTITDIPVNATVLWFAFGITLLTALVFGVMPAFQSAAASGNETLKSFGRSASSSSQAIRSRRVLIAAEISFSLILLAGAGLMVESLERIHRENIGFNPDHVLGLEVFLPPNQYGNQPEKQATFAINVIDKLRAVPGVQSVAATNYLPLTGFLGNTDFVISGQPPVSGVPKPKADNRLATPGYFSTMQIALLRGRDFADSDRSGSEPVAIVNSTLARRYFGNTDPIGKVIEISDPTRVQRCAVVGVVADIKAFTPEQAPHPEIYRPIAQTPSFLLGFVVRTKVDPASLLKPAKQAIWSVDHNQPVFDAMPLSSLAAQSITVRRTSTALIATFAVLALILAAVGLYGGMAYAVAQRTAEIGIRIALGARRVDVLGLVLRNTLQLVIVGEAVGLIVALILGRAVSSFLFGISPTDPSTLAVAATLLAVVALVATYLPARRAAKVDPMVALRYE